MGVNLLGEKKLRKLRFEVADDSIDRAFVFSHHEWWVVWFVTADHRHGWYNVRTREYDFVGVDEEWCVSSCQRFADYEQRRMAQAARDQARWRLKRSAS